ncbi:hypothetical protein F511_35550 [Dorcoceras hygrometricum]|uniref:Uncharacterized protein n=1 Tax=Dorcoceras hygrometricum TaxID=472368 RepID=A0A2Z7BBS5_9LAMI|nr:hypothetical protein F511_35550 [Dorcoceras hygrometricum]
MVSVSSPLGKGMLSIKAVINCVLQFEGSHTSILPPTILNKLSLVSIRELRNKYFCDPQWFRDTASRGFTTFVTPKSHFRTNHRIMVKRLATSPHDPLGINDSACKNQSVMVRVQYGPFNSNIPITSTTIGKSRVARDPITMHTSWRSNSDIACVTREHCYVLSMQMDSDLVIYRTTLVRTFQVVTICLVDKSESTGCVLGKWVYQVTLEISLFDLQDVCIVIGSLATLDIPMVVDLIGIYVLKGPYCTLTMTNWFLQALSVIPRGSWGDVARRFTMIRWASSKL